MYPPDFYGFTEDDVVEKIESGETMTQIAQEKGKNRSMLTRWVEANEQRSARVMRARQKSAAAFEEKAEDEIRAANDPFELAKARELAHHFRWRASKIDKPSYGDKLDLTVKDSTTAEELSIDELTRIAAGGGSRAAEAQVSANIARKVH